MKHVCTFLASALLLGAGSQSAMAASISMFDGDAKVDVQEFKDFEFRLKAGESLQITANGIEGQPISTFFVEDTETAHRLTEMSERKSIETTVEIPKDGIYRLHFFNNSSFVEKVYQIRIALITDDESATGYSRRVDYDEQLIFEADEIYAGTTALDIVIQGVPAMACAFNVSEEQAGNLAIFIGVDSIGKPVRDLYDQILSQSDASYAQGLREGSIKPIEIRSMESVDWYLIPEPEWQSFMAGQPVRMAGRGEGLTVAAKRLEVHAGAYIFVAMNSTNPDSPAVYLELQAERAVMQRTRKESSEL